MYKSIPLVSIHLSDWESCLIESLNVLGDLKISLK